MYIFLFFFRCKFLYKFSYTTTIAARASTRPATKHYYSKLFTADSTPTSITLLYR